MFFGKHNDLIPLRLVCKCLILVKNLNFLWPPENGHYFFLWLICWALVSSLWRSKKAVPRSIFNMWPGARGGCAIFVPLLGGWGSSPALLEHGGAPALISPNWTSFTPKGTGTCLGKSNIATYGISVAGETHKSSDPLQSLGFTRHKSSLLNRNTSP